MRLVLLAATFHTTSAALALPSVLTTRGHNATAYSATLDDLREAVETLESLTPLWTRVFGASHPETPKMQRALKEARFRARNTLASRRDA